MTAESIRARPAEPPDTCPLRDVCVESWRRAYAGLLPDAYVEANLETFYTADRLRREIEAPGEAGRWLVAVESGASSPAGRVFGAGRGTPPMDGRCEVFTLYVHPEYQGRRAGSTLLSTITAEQRAEGGREQVVEVFAGHEPAIGFYEHHGFDRIGERRTDVVAAVDLDHRTIRMAREI
ncbi:GNAT family N-acetyltransferase [Halovivax cerinus]|uniref:GNAT family N-acetyltransferase n=1 Tax=Halovivax cerinus TaxID=1487865 RepID=A0ABD5NNF6_9EURY|nr:N-acetyltransferase [Halovivax cerinus]